MKLTDRLHKLRKPRFLLGYIVGPLLFFFSHITEQRFALGLALALLGETVRLWANGYVGHVKVNWTKASQDDPKIGRLITAGPYAFIRHPLYFGTLLIGAGFCVIAGNLGFGLAAAAGFLIVYRRKMAEEEALIIHEAGDAYRSYQAAVPRWVPSWRRYPHRRGKWSWQGIVASKEWKTVIWVSVGLIAFYLKEEILQEHEAFFIHDRWKHIAVLTALVLLPLADGALELLRRRAALPRVISAGSRR